MNLREEYDSLVRTINDWDMCEDTINNVKDIDKRQEFFAFYLDELLYQLRGRFVKWESNNFSEIWPIERFCKVVRKLDTSYDYYWGIYYFFKRDYKKSFKCLKDAFNLRFSDLKIEEINIVDDYFGIFYNRFPEFWSNFIKLLSENNAESGIKELCIMIPKFYNCSTDEEKVIVLQEFIQRYPIYVLPKELLADVYSNMGMWRNCIALFEQIEGKNLLFGDNSFYFMLAWAYGKVKDYKQEEKAYRKCIECDVNYPYAMNNLGFNLYNQKKYDEALKIFECEMKENRAKHLPANNYVRTLLKMGKNKEAKEFVASTKFKIVNDLMRRVDNKLDANKEIAYKEESLDVFDIKGRKSKDNFNSRKIEQFTNEKLLEDEIINRIEKGVDTFGLNLHVYKRKGEYGRQYIIPIGRLDLLCEDNNNNLYVIELKKDSGYDDAYAQTKAYLDWFEKEKKFNGKNIFGIICLNAPTEKLIKQVRKDKRIKLFEYQISYNEI